LKEIFVQDNKYTIFEDTTADQFEVEFNEYKPRNVRHSIWSSGGSQSFDQAEGDEEHGAVEDKNGIRAPMPGNLVKMLVKPGDKVASGKPLLVLEAMKMEHTIKAPKDVTIKKVNYKEGQFVDAGEQIVAFE